MVSSFSLLSQLPSKPKVNQVFGPKHFVVGSCDLFVSNLVSQKSASDNWDDQFNDKDNMLISSPRGPDERSYQGGLNSLYKDVCSSEEDDSTQSDDNSSSFHFSALPFEEHHLHHQQAELPAHYNEYLDFLAEKLMLQEDGHQNLVGQLQTLKQSLSNLTTSFQPEHLIQNRRRPSEKELVVKLLAIESDLNAFSVKLSALSRGVLTRQIQVTLSATEVQAFNSSMAFKSERISMLGIGSQSILSKKMISEINDSQIYCNLLSLWSDDLIKFNHSMCYEISNLQSQLADLQVQLRGLKNSLWTQREFL
eukprot:TRINITY_DN6456_c0_g2_i2.p1 TRINITY_DN6456_c0_g2~~TRINITY_DN6456_c0_g2_i2.p1  ORF type:complete len:308 (-),score=22.05 TRINITY_DN6456_c0_g2_i2:2830-3753(-)